jgi:uncharacterized integral membrane protein
VGISLFQISFKNSVKMLPAGSGIGLLTLLWRGAAENQSTMAMDEKVVRYTLTHKDVFAFNLRALVRNRVVLIMTALMMVALMYISFNTVPKDGQTEYPLAVRIVVALVMGVVVLAVMSGIQLLTLALTIWTKKFKGVLGEHELTLSDAGMLTRSADGETLRKWTGLMKVASTRNYLYLYVNETMAQIVPKRYFSTVREADAFEQYIRSRMQRG